MYTNYIPNALPFWPKIDFQHFRRNYTNTDTDTFQNLIVYRTSGGGTKILQTNRLEIKVNAATAPAASNFKIWRVVKSDITGASDALVETLATTSWASYSLNPNDDPADTVWSIGQSNTDYTLTNALSTYEIYYFTIDVEGSTYYSETFYPALHSGIDNAFPRACADGGFVLVQYTPTDECVIGETIHPEHGAFQMYLPIGLGQPSYNYRRDADEAGDGNDYTNFQRLDKRYTFFYKCYEHMADALATIQLFDRITLQWENGADMVGTNVSVSVEWESDYLANVEVSFSANLLTRGACC